MGKNRIQYIDIARGIAMICIVLGHLANSQINRVVFTFHVPIFFFITGYFTNTNLSVKSFIKNKARLLILPYIFTCVAIIILNTLNDFVFIGSDAAKQTFGEWVYAAIYGAGDSYSYPFYIKSIGALWFLWATFWGSIFLRLLLSVRGAGTRIALVLVLFAAGYWSCNLFWFPLSLQAGCCATLFLYLGYLIRICKDTWGKIPLEAKAVGTILALLIWIDFIKKFKSFWLVHCDIGRGIIDIFGCICACYVIILISWYIENHIGILSKILSFLGKNSLFMLCVHSIELNVFPWWQVSQKFIDYGMPEFFRLYFFIIGKLLLIIIFTLIFANCIKIRKAFGISGKEGNIKKHESNC